MENKLFVAFLIEHPEYLMETTYQKEILGILRGMPQSGKINELFIEFFRKECEPLIDSLVGLDQDKQKKLLITFSRTGITKKVFCEILSSLNGREMQSLVKNIYTSFCHQKQVIVVKTPRELPTLSRKKIRNYYKNNGVVFYTQEDLIGGMLVYNNGAIFDYSFSSFLSHIYSLNT